MHRFHLKNISLPPCEKMTIEKELHLKRHNSISGFFESLSKNSAFIQRISELVVVSFLGFIILSCLCILFPSLLGSLGEMAGEEVKELAAGVFSEGGLRILAAYLFVFVIDACCLGYKNSALKSVLNPDNSTKKDIYIFLLLIAGVWRYVIMLSFFMIGYYAHSQISGHFEINLVASFQSTLTQTIVFFIVVDFLGYWQHRFGHRVSWWWSIHRLHHSAQKFNILAVARAHPLDLALRGVFIGIPMGLLGVPMETFVIFELLKAVHGKFLHSMVDWDLGSVGKYVFMTPIAHRVHHSPDPIHWDKNYGQVLVCWDRMFGTWYGGKEINRRVGLWEEPASENGLLFDIIQGQLQFFALFFSKWKFDIGVLKPERIPVLSEKYRESCKAEGIIP